MPGGLTTLHRSCKNVRDTVPSPADRVLATIDSLADEAVAFTSDLIRIPTVNPPGELYDDCARFIGAMLERCGFAVEYHAAEGRAEHTAAHPRVNVIGTRAGRSRRPLVHLNGHFDVVPAGDGWTVDPFGGEVRDGRIWGRGTCDMKAGIAAAVFAAEAIRRAGIELNGTVEISGTVDEESGGFAGVAWLAQQKRIHADRTDFAIIPEPLYVDRICIGHRGVYWFEVQTTGRIAHGSMPFHGVNAIDHMGIVLDRMRRNLLPRIAARSTAMPVEPAGARFATLNINGIDGGQAVDGIQTPCVADRCRAVFDRRFLIEEGFDTTRAEIVELLDRAAADVPDLRYELRDLMVVHPVRTPDDSPLIDALDRGLRRVLGRSGGLVASPGTYDHKHVTRIGGVSNCVAYGPGILDLAHQPDEWCGVDDLVSATKVIALALLELTGTLS
jgi:succinyl-diaminopimelate desuccinylase